LLDVYLDAQRVQGLQTCIRLRNYERYFFFDPKRLDEERRKGDQDGGDGGMSQTESNPNKADDEKDKPSIFRKEEHKFIENIPYAYRPYEAKMSAQEKEIQASLKSANKQGPVISKDELTVLDEFAIPSSYTLMDAVAARPDERSKFQAKIAVLIEEKAATDREKLIAYMEGKDDPKQRIDEFLVGLKKDGRNTRVNIYFEDFMKQPDAENDPEKHLKQCLPTFTKRDLEEPEPQMSSKDKERIKARLARQKTLTGNPKGEQTLDYEEALYFSDSKYAKLINHY
jgi:hypothetical protein